MMSQHPTPTRMATLHRVATTTLPLHYYEADDGVTSFSSKSLESLLSKSKKKKAKPLQFSNLSASCLPPTTALVVPAPSWSLALILPYQQT
jgi:hypothetical protein